MVNRRGQLSIATAVVALALIGVTTSGALRKNAVPSPPPQPIVIKMRRTCERCANYVIVLTSEGRLTYEGLDRAHVLGRRESTLDPWTTSVAIRDFVESGFYNLEKTYPSPGKRMVVTMSIEMDGAGMSKTVESEDRYGPLLITELEHMIDDLPGMRDLSGWAY